MVQVGNVQVHADYAIRAVHSRTVVAALRVAEGQGAVPDLPPHAEHHQPLPIGRGLLVIPSVIGKCPSVNAPSHWISRRVPQSLQLLLLSGPDPVAHNITNALVVTSSIDQVHRYYPSTNLDMACKSVQ